MSISASISRFTAFRKRHGLGATIRRAIEAARRALFSGRMALFFCDLSTLKSSTQDLPAFLKVERCSNQADLSPHDLEQITSFWNPELARHRIKERFELGASVWLIRVEENLAGYGWTLQGRTVEPHYFPLAADDVQFLDFHVFPKFRGRAIDWFLMTYILHRLAAEGKARAFGEAAEWNQASLSSFAMTPFRRLGFARKLTILGRTIVWWDQDQTLTPKPESKKRSVVVAARKQRQDSRLVNAKE